MPVALDQEGSEVEWVVLFFKECLGILEISQERQAADGGAVLQVHAGFDSISYSTIRTNQWREYFPTITFEFRISACGFLSACGI